MKLEDVKVTFCQVYVLLKTVFIKILEQVLEMLQSLVF